jgi:hypothetical protein
MSANDLFGGDLPSDDDSEDEDYVSDGLGSSSSSDHEMDQGRREKSDFKKEMQKVRIDKLFAELRENEELKLDSEDHSDVVIDPLMLALQQRIDLVAERENRPRSATQILQEIKKYTPTSESDPYTELCRLKRQSRNISSDRTEMMALAAEARSGLEGSKIEVQETVRFAGEVVTLKKSVERSSTHAIRFEKRQRLQEQQSESLGTFQTYLNSIKSKRAVTSVEKSAADWNRVKMSSEGLEEALRSGRGYIENQSFLVRADFKEDELRRDARRKKLFQNNS